MASIARALGHEIEDEYLVSLIERDQIKNGIYSSMCMDACWNRPMEVEVRLQYYLHLRIETFV